MVVETERLVSVREYADYKGVSLTAVYKWIDKGEVRGVKIGIFNFVMLELDEARKIKERKVPSCFKG